MGFLVFIIFVRHILFATLRIPVLLSPLAIEVDRKPLAIVFYVSTLHGSVQARLFLHLPLAALPYCPV